MPTDNFSIEIGNLFITKGMLSQNGIWISKKDGKGMEISEEKLIELLEKFYKEYIE